MFQSMFHMSQSDCVVWFTQLILQSMLSIFKVLAYWGIYRMTLLRSLLIYISFLKRHYLDSLMLVRFVWGHVVYCEKRPSSFKLFGGSCTKTKQNWRKRENKLFWFCYKSCHIVLFGGFTTILCHEIYVPMKLMKENLWIFYLKLV